ncbi:hypothetical protein CathTA2_0818 [Caldalkalibacillus thermarum TA2.A1]|uniref:Uncharacterized protein n=1 Tax=Caldalkalibacillus thermarum (strain TA2.A1) TaxID=986075 RepID=F5L4V5_CALTT|nr:hypothetical protein [Caldalkalibacillus thermarum]EGL83607.1 hypothetical protein CathTA2_0818 [Caldalkalibacillus thermarum TA2.A1]QZT33706.1 hypothetical protein HUR95_16025 [Caldalkalibacillus thermarum TA2.A1]
MHIIATGKKDIDQMIQRVAGGNLPPVAYREGVLLQLKKNRPQLAFLSPLLQGTMPFEQLLYELRKAGVRVVVLVGHTKPKEIREKWLPLSVYDYILDPVTEEKIRFAIEFPATLGMAEEKIERLEKGDVEDTDEGNDRDTNHSKWAWFGWKKKKEPIQKTRDHQTAQEPGQKPHNSVQPPAWSFIFGKEENQPLHKQEPAQQKQDTLQAWSFEPVPVTPSESQKPNEHDGNGLTNHQVHTPAETVQSDERNEPVFHFSPNMTGFARQEPQGYNIIVTSPLTTGKTYVALNLAATLSKQGTLTKLISFQEETTLWTYLDMPVGKNGQVQGYPNLHIETFENMDNQGHYRVIDLPFERWNMVMHWENVLVVYVEDMDIHHQKICEKHREAWQGKRLLRVLNRFVPNVLESGQEQRLRMNADLVLSDLPVHLVAMRYGRPVIHLDQTAAREFEFATKTILSALPRTQENIKTIG